MLEVRTKVFTLEEFENRYRMEAFDKREMWVITKAHTISDILRFLIDEAGAKDELRHCLDRMEWP